MWRSSRDDVPGEKHEGLHGARLGSPLVDRSASQGERSLGGGGRNSSRATAGFKFRVAQPPHNTASREKRDMKAAQAGRVGLGRSPRPLSARTSHTGVDVWIGEAAPPTQPTSTLARTPWAQTWCIVDKIDGSRSVWRAVLGGGPAIQEPGAGRPGAAATTSLCPT